MGATALVDQYPSQKENIQKAYSAILGAGDSMRGARDATLDFVGDLPKSRVIPEREDPIADAVYTGMNWLNPNILAKGATKVDKLFDIGTGLAAAGGEYVADEVGELTGGLSVVAADVLRSFRSKLPKGDSAASVAKQIFKQTDNPEDVIAKAETPENAGKTLTEIAPETKPLTDMAQVEVTNRQLQAQNKLLEATAI